MEMINSSTSTENNIQENRFKLIYLYIYCAIGVSALLSNGLLCSIFVRRRKMLQQGYNIIIFTLAIIDTLTGITLVAVATFQLHLFPQTPEKNDNDYEPIKALLLKGWLEFYFGLNSVLLVMFLAIERWFAVKRPIQYHCKFHYNRVYVYIISVVVFTTLYFIAIVFVNITNNISGIKGITTVGFVLIFVIPLLVTWITFIDLWLHSRNYPHQNTYNSRTRQKLVNMCAITAIFFTVCWLPVEIYYFKISMGFIRFNYFLSKCYDSFAMSNSIVNPWIYYFTNLKYRKEMNAAFKVVLTSLYFLPSYLKSESYVLGKSDKIRQSASSQSFSLSNYKT